MNPFPPAAGGEVDVRTLAFEADQACWGSCVNGVRHQAMLVGLDVGFVDRSGSLVSLTVSGRRAILDPFMRHVEACFGVALRSARPSEGGENFPTLPAARA